jgi:hypothetical protein
MSFLVINSRTNYPYKERSSINFKSYTTEGRAKAMATRLSKKDIKINGELQSPYWYVMSYSAWTERYNPMVTKKNLMTGQDIQVRKYEPLCTDPSSETYWSM